MPIFLSRLFAHFAKPRSWATPVALIGFVFATSWPLMTLAEPDSDLVAPHNYWWYFVVTAATVGYGDYFPKTGTGHVVGLYVIFGGIATLTTVFTRLATVMDKAKGRRMQGAISTTARDHVVLIGYTAGRTERIVAELLAESGPPVVLCGWDEVPAHPMPEEGIDFVRGDPSDEATLRRAGLATARTVLVDARDDNEALAVTVTVNHVNPGAHVVVALRDLSRAALVHYVDAAIRCVQWHSPWMVTEELTSPGIAEVYTELMTPGGVNTYSMRLPADLGPVQVGRCQTALGRHHGVTVLAARTEHELLVNPTWDTELPAGAEIYYLAAGRLTPDQITTAVRHTVPPLRD
ncbi:MAG TPA: NAD-binding protein [Actinophytocola sp.]|uniref:potassium channel family protein n=1 Tax=Actinophytocola sp. TaxID=1872138 RepID=UPI002DBCD748|nr:NAD-binding protein [Actinophytocola sp.]HEU5470257.1 NAD-binding protein [Actinophytocola sp.]